MENNDIFLEKSKERNSFKLKDLTRISILTGTLCITAPLSIPLPFSPVPITLATFFVGLFPILVGSKKAFISILLYFLIGIIGIPVFAGGTSGFDKVIGPTGGYLIGYLFIVIFTGLFNKKSPTSLTLTIIGMLLGTLMCYLVGTLWLKHITQMSLRESLFAGVIPYIPFDLVKIILSSIIGINIKKRLPL